MGSDEDLDFLEEFTPPAIDAIHECDGIDRPVASSQLRCIPEFLNEPKCNDTYAEASAKEGSSSTALAQGTTTPSVVTLERPIAQALKSHQDYTDRLKGSPGVPVSSPIGAGTTLPTAPFKLEPNHKSSLPPFHLPTRPALPLPPPSTASVPVPRHAQRARKSKDQKYLRTNAPPPVPLNPLPQWSVDNSTGMVASYTEFIPTVYADESKPEDKLIRSSFGKKIYVSFHAAWLYDLEKHVALLRTADTEVWYCWPTASTEVQISSLCRLGQNELAVECLDTDMDGRPISPLNASVPRVWASKAMSTPLDDDIYNCLSNHDNAFRNCSGACETCIQSTAEKLKATSLVYTIVLSTYMDPAPEFGARGPSPTGKVFKLFKCGSRDSAAAEAFYASGVQGWDVVFSCVMRAEAQHAFARGTPVVRADRLHELANEDKEEVAGTRVRMFY